MAANVPLLTRIKDQRWKLRRMISDPKPWFDAPDALEELDRRLQAGNYTAAQGELLRHWITDGYLVLSGVVALELVDRYVADLLGVWTTDKPYEGLTIDGVQLKAGGETASVPHSAITALPQAGRDRIRDTCRWRFHQFNQFSAAAREIYMHPAVMEWASRLFSLPAGPHNSISFMYGSEQHLHQDMAVFSVFPENFLIGSWLIRCEDIHPDSGPLVIYPGSHRTKMYAGFDNYPQTSLRTCTKETRAEYEKWLEKAAEGYERVEYMAKKGDVLLWHGMLIHGGSPIRDPARTRKSFILHYIPDGMNRSAEIHGPFNW